MTTGEPGTDDVAAAMASLDRRAFLPADQQPHADEDRPLPIGLGQTCSQPSTVAAMLRLLAVPPGAKVLDVGAGSGWTTAILARLADGGRLVMPVAETMWLVERRGAEVVTSPHGPYRFVPLRSEPSG